MPNHIAVMFNQGAGLGRGHETLHRSVTAMRQQGLDMHLVPLTPEPSWRVQIEKQLAQGLDTVVAAGGDGTVNSIAGCLLNTHCRLGVIPTGTFNHFAKHIGMPLDIPAACEVIRHGRTQRIDVGEVNGIAFLNFSSIGLYADILHTFVERQRLGWPKRLALLWAFVDIFRPYPPLKVELTKASEGAQIQTPLVFVGNNHYRLGGFDLLQACGDFRSGILQVAYGRAHGRLKLLRLLASVLCRRPQLEHDLTMTGLRSFQVLSSRSRLRVAVDGELKLLQPPLHYHVRHQALKVIVPKT